MTSMVVGLIQSLRENSTLIAWIVGVLLAIAGVGALTESLLSAVGGLFWLFAAVLILPATRPLVLDWLSDRTGGFEFGAVGMAVLAVTAFMLGGAVMPSTPADPSATTQDQPPVTTTSAPAATTEVPTTDAPASGATTGVATADTTTAAPTTSQTTTTPTTTTSPTTTATPTPTTVQQTTTQSDLQSSWTVEVVEVVDGDTMDVRMPDGSIETIRLLGVDTPEGSTGDVSPGEWEGVPDSANGRHWLVDWGEQATDYAQQRLSTGSTIYIEVDETADRRGYYGRLLVYAYQSESASTSFNHRLLTNGYARLYESEFSERSAFSDAEQDAQDADTGVWGYEPPQTTEQPAGGESGNLVVAEIHEDAEGNDHENLNDEYVVFENTGEGTLDMGGWTLADEADHTYYFPSGFTLDPGETVTVYTGSGTDSDSELYWESGSAIWNNGGDTIIVTTDDGETVISHEYS